MSPRACQSPLHVPQVVVRQRILPVECSSKVIVFAEAWPCWLSCLLAENVRVQAAFVTKEMIAVFPQQAHWLSLLTDFELMTSVPDEWHKYTLLGSGSHEFLRLIMPKLRHHVGPFIFANDMAFTGRRCSKVNRLHRSWAAHDYRMGLESTTVRHADFGGITSAVHGISFRGVDISIFTPSAPLPRTLRHVLSDTTPDATQEISAPTPLTDPQPRVPVYIDGMMRREGLFDIGKPTAPIACPCVFKPTGWGRRSLSAKELL